MSEAVQTAQERLMQTVRSGDWERVPAQAEAYAAAVRADERQRVVDDATEALKGVLDADGAGDRSPAEIRAACLAAVERLR